MPRLPVPYPGSPPARPPAPPLQVPTHTRGTVLLGVFLVLVLFGGLGTWVVLAPLKSAAVAPGLVAVENQRKTIQHLEGGIVRELFVKNGDYVRKGDLLLVLDQVKAGAVYERVLSSLRHLAAMEARLKAERDGAQAVIFSHPALADRDDPEVARVIAQQTHQFESRRANYEGRRAVLQQRNAQLERQIEGLRKQVASTEEQLRLIELELKDVRTLVAKRLARKPRLLALQRSEASLQGKVGELEARIALANERMTETRLKLLTMEAERAENIDKELADVQPRLADVEERVKQSKDVLTRTQIIAPVSGKIINLRAQTIGGVLRPGEPILEIVPDKDRLVIEAQVQPLDIDVVHPGLPAQVRFTAFSFRRTPSVQGEVVYVSADRMVDPATGRAFYVAHVSIPQEEMALVPEVKLYPGMPVDVLIETGERTVAEAVLAPVLDSMARAFREQ